MDIKAYLITYKAIGKLKYKSSTGVVLALSQEKAVELANELMEKKSEENENDLVFKICNVKRMSCDFFLIQDLKKNSDE